MGGIGKKGKAGLVRIVDHVSDALDAKRELFLPGTEITTRLFMQMV
jgi:succinyl-CoA synthetase beta subunit